MRRFLTLAVLSLSFFSSTTATKIPDMKFRRLDTQEGLSSSQVNCVFRDSRGFVWIGTPYGLNRYDGYRFKTFYSNIRDTTSMRDNYTDQVYEAYDGKLWLKQGMNYCVYDPKTESFERNATRILQKFGIDGGIEFLAIDENKNFWVKLYEQGIFYYNPKKRKLNQFKLGYEKNQFNPTYGVSSITTDGDKVIISTNCGEMVCMDGEHGMIDWENKWIRQNGGLENQDYRLTIDPDGNYWMVTLNNTFIYVKKENRWYRSIPEFLHSRGFSDVPDEMLAWSVVFDRHGWLWVTVDHGGVYVIDLKGHQLRQFTNNKYDETTISDNTPRSLYMDQDGQMWIATYKNGVNQYVEGMESLRNLELGDVNTVCEDKHGYWWVGTNDQGILVYDPRSGEVVSRYTRDNSGLIGNIIVGSLAASDGTIWFGSYNGGLIHCIPSAANPTQATIVTYRATDDGKGLSNNSVWALTEDKWHRIWYTTLGGGAQMFDPKNKTFKTWNTKNSQIGSDYLTSIGWTKKGWVLVGSSWYYSLINPVSGKLVAQTLPEDPAITVVISSSAYVIEDSRGLIWQGSTSGLTVYDPKTKFMTLLDMTKGLYGSSINSIVEDKKHTIWTVTDHGVSSIVPVRQDDGTWQFNIRSYNSRDGLQKATYNQRSTLLTRDGRVLVGGQGGLDVIDPSKLKETKSTERPVFSGLQIFDQDVQVGKEVNGRVILKEALDVCRSISLHFNDQFTIQLGTNEVTVKNSKRFAYRLEGFNENWVKTSEQNPNITYNSLRAGSYTLYVRMLNDDGSLGNEESTLQITIHPPLWRTRWMVLLYMLVIALAAWLWRKRFLKQQEERMQLELLRRDTEKKHWMSEMRKQMQAEAQQSATEEAKVFVASEDGQVEAQELPRERVDLVPLFRDVCDHFTPPAAKNIRLSFFPFVDNVEIMGHQGQLRQMLDILLANAVAFSPSNSKVKVFVERNADKAVLRVADSGVGIPDEVKPHLFEEIIGDDDSPNLHMVFDIVTNHHGTVSAEENHGGGTVFTIELPCEKEIEVEEAVLMDDEEENDDK